MEKSFVEEITLAMNSIDSGYCNDYLDLLLITYFDFMFVREFKKDFMAEIVEEHINRIKVAVDRKHSE